MQAMQLVAHGNEDALRWQVELPTPAPGPGQVRIRVHRTGVNHVDLVVRRGYPGIPVALPHIPGGDVVGVIDAVGAGVADARLGTRVVAYPLLACGACPPCLREQGNLCDAWRYLGLHLHGGYAQAVVVPAASALPLPDTVDDDRATALPVAGLTALHALNVGELTAGQTILLWGAAGALGSTAIQLAKHRGANVIAVVSSEARAAAAGDLGADLVVRRDRDDVAAVVRGHCPRGVDVVLDFVGPATFATSVDLLAKGGRVLVCGMITGREAMLPIHALYLKHASVRGLYLGTRAELGELIALCAARQVQPLVGEVLPLRAAAAAQTLLERGTVPGKIVLAVD